MRVLVTGACGFVGRYLTEELRQNGHTMIGFDAVQAPDTTPDGALYQGDITNVDALRDCLAREKPEGCIHLAGIAYVPLGWTDPKQVMDVNLNGTLNVLEAFREIQPGARMLFVTSSEVYGREERPEPVREKDALQPSNLYGVSKMAADLSALLYHRHYGMPVMTARPQNHIGPRQSRLFVVSSFARQLIAMQGDTDTPQILRTGNLESRRDFTDVRDVVRAYRLLLEKGRPGEAYNIASSRMVPIREMLDQLCAHARLQPAIETDPDLYRETDRPPLLCTEKIKQDTAWAPSIPLPQTLRDIYDDLAEQAARDTHGCAEDREPQPNRPATVKRFV